MERPRIVCLCGSSRFANAFSLANLRETLAGKIVLSMATPEKGNEELFSSLAPEERANLERKLEELHLRRIDMSDEILVLNVNGYVGDSTLRAISYARQRGKDIRWLDEHKIPAATSALLFGVK